MILLRHALSKLTIDWKDLCDVEILYYFKSFWYVKIH